MSWKVTLPERLRHNKIALDTFRKGKNPHTFECPLCPRVVVGYNGGSLEVEIKRHLSKVHRDIYKQVLKEDND